MSHCDVLHPHSVTKMHHPPCCSLCTPSIHSSSMPISASCDLLPSNLMTTPSLRHLSLPPHWGTSFSLLRFPTFFNFSYKHWQLYLSSASCSVNTFFPFTQLILSFHILPCLCHPFSYPTPPFLCQSAVTGFVGEGLAVSMSSHSQQW